VFKMPDLGEGTVDAEIVAWHTKPGDAVTEDQLIVEVMTDKAAVEVPAPVSGRVVSISGAPGDKVAVGSPLIVFDMGEALGAPAPSAPAASLPSVAPPMAAPSATPTSAPALASTPPVRTGRVMASPADRRRAHEAGIDLSTVAGSGRAGASCAPIWIWLWQNLRLCGAAYRAARPPTIRDPPQPKSRSLDCAASSLSA